MQKRIKKNQYCKRQRQRERMEEHIKCQTTHSTLEGKSSRGGYRFKGTGLKDSSQNTLRSGQPAHWAATTPGLPRAGPVARRAEIQTPRALSALPAGPLQSRQVEDVAEQREISLLLFASSVFLLLNPPKCSSETVSTNSTSQPHHRKGRWWLQHHSASR